MELVEDSTSDSEESVVFLNSSEERKISDRRTIEDKRVNVEEKVEHKCMPPKQESNVRHSSVPAKSKKYPCDTVKETKTREKLSKTEIKSRNDVKKSEEFCFPMQSQRRVSQKGDKKKPMESKLSDKRKLKAGKTLQINHTDNKSPMKRNEDVSDDSGEFEKHFKNDVNFVHAKYAAKKPLALRVEETPAPKGFLKKFRRALLQADILAIKQRLDSSGSSLPPPRFPQPPPQHSAGPQKKPKTFPPFSEVSSTPPFLVKVPQMPVVDFNSNISEVTLPVVQKLECLADPPAAPTPRTVQRRHKVPLPPRAQRKQLQPLQSAVLFPSSKPLKFSIPRASKPAVTVTRGETVGRLWKEALGVDSTGQWREEGGVRRKLRRSTGAQRPLLEYEAWLVRGRRGDTLDWGLGQGEARGRRAGRPQPGDPLGLREEGAVLETRVHQHQPISRMEAWLEVEDEEEERLAYNSLDLSRQSVVTHIQSPTHTFLANMSDYEYEEEAENRIRTSVPSYLEELPGLPPTVSSASPSCLTPSLVYSCPPPSPVPAPPCPPTSQEVMATSSSSGSLAGLVSRQRKRLKLQM